MRLIDANALAKLFSDAFRHNGCKDMTYSEYMNVIRNAPTIDPEALGYRKVVRGRYITDDMGDSKCSVCGENYLDCTKNYCPNCAAQMDAEGGEE